MRRVLIVLTLLALVAVVTFFLLKGAPSGVKWPLSSFTPPKIVMIDFKSGKSSDFSLAPKPEFLVNKIVVNNAGTRAAVWETKKDDFVFSESIVEVIELTNGKRETW